MWNLRVGLSSKWKDLISVAIGEDAFEERKTEGGREVRRATECSSPNWTHTDWM